jgi:dTDP-N-acetylfucosamine:lipid II N-acetylfucosaminyltransferase
MNLHVVPDNSFINKFCDNLQELGLWENNKVIVRSNEGALKSIKHNLSFAPLYSSRFSSLIGNTSQYEKVFIHYLTPLLYRWLAKNDFQEVNWMIWGGDLYNLPALDRVCYESKTWDEYVRKDWSAQTLLYNLKIKLTQSPFKEKAYSKIKHVLTWMSEEYNFAINHLPVKANHSFFFYENQLPYGKLDALIKPANRSQKLSLILGNSGSPTNNHLDAIQFLEDNRIPADLLVPVSYGNKRYISFLKKRLKFKYGKIEFVDRYMAFEEYLNFLGASDGLIMNTVRPQGYGNILMMMYLGKSVFFNTKNVSLPDLDSAGLKWLLLEDLRRLDNLKADLSHKEAIMKLLSHDRLMNVYQNLFN